MLIKNLLIKKEKVKTLIFYTCQFEFYMKRERGKFKRIRKLGKSEKHEEKVKPKGKKSERLT